MRRAPTKSCVLKIIDYNHHLLWAQDQLMILYNLRFAAQWPFEILILFVASCHPERALKHYVQRKQTL